MDLLLFFKIYRGDAFATFLSIIGFCVRVAGIIFVLTDAIPAGVLTIIAGLGLAIYAESR